MTQEFNVVRLTMCMPRSTTTLGSIFISGVSQTLHRVSYIVK